MNKLYSLIAAAVLSVTAIQLNAQITCNPAGNLWVYTNYDGGVLNINCDVNIPNIKIGVCTYEPVTINLSGAYVGNVTEVRYAGYVSTNNMHCSNSPTTTTITGVPANITSVNFLPPSTLSNPNGYTSIVCAYSCSTSSNQGGCNTADQIKAYFQTSMSATLVSYFTQYGCWSAVPYLLSSGGNCCNSVPTCLIAANAGSDQQMCAGDFVTLNGTATGGATVYSWSPTAGLSNPNSATTTASPTITTTYVLTAGDGVSCSDLDTIVVTVNPVPVVNLGPDTIVCNTAVSVDAGPHPNCVFLWGDNSTTQSVPATVSGSYHVVVTNTLTGCSGGDTVALTFQLRPNLNLGGDTTLCGNSFLINAGNPGATYLWYNSSTQQTVTVFTSGTYSVVITDPNGCTASDAIALTLNSLPVVTFTAAVPVVCLADQSFALTTGSPAGGSYSGTGVSAGNFDPQAAGIGTHAITYAFTDSIGCTSSATDSVMVDACLSTGGISAFGARLFPNPSDGNFQVEVSQPCVAVLSNSVGQIVETKLLLPGSNTMGDNKLAEGIYTLHLTSDQNYERTMRVIIHR